LRPEPRRLTIRKVRSLRETSNGNRYLECETDIGIVAVWGDATDSRNLTRVQAMTPPVAVTAGTIASRWPQHAWWVPQSADVTLVDGPSSPSGHSRESRAGAAGAQGRGHDQRQTDRRPEGQHAIDPYSVLGVPQEATFDEIRAAYLACIKQYHPDQVAHLGKELRDLAHQKSQEINWAYQVLTGGKK
jgi:hypothetical protein